MIKYFLASRYEKPVLDFEIWSNSYPLLQRLEIMYKLLSDNVVTIVILKCFIDFYDIWMV
jgi:hypothetical protein